MRIWLSGPRLFGLVRPGISFALSELTKPSRRAKRCNAVEPTAELEPPREAVQSRLAEYPLHARIAAWVIWGFAIWGLISMVGCMFSGAHAGTCRYYSDGPDTVTACEDGTFAVRDRDGRVRQYGEPNAGFDRYPGQREQPVFERWDGDLKQL
jgi:hypothetical protein